MSPDALIAPLLKLDETMPAWMRLQASHEDLKAGTHDCQMLGRALTAFRAVAESGVYKDLPDNAQWYNLVGEVEDVTHIATYNPHVFLLCFRTVLNVVHEDFGPFLALALTVFAANRIDADFPETPAPRRRWFGKAEFPTQDDINRGFARQILVKDLMGVWDSLVEACEQEDPEHARDTLQSLMPTHGRHQEVLMPSFFVDRSASRIDDMLSRGPAPQ